MVKDFRNAALLFFLTPLAPLLKGGISGSPPSQGGELTPPAQGENLQRDGGLNAGFGKPTCQSFSSGFCMLTVIVNVVSKFLVNSIYFFRQIIVFSAHLRTQVIKPIVNIIKSIVNIIKPIVKAIVNIIKPTVKAIVNITNPITYFIKSFVKTIANIIKPFVKAIANITNPMVNY